MEGVWFCLHFFLQRFAQRSVSEPHGGPTPGGVQSEQEVDGWFEEEGSISLSHAALVPSLRHAAFHLQHVGPAFKLVCVSAVLYVLRGEGDTSGREGD